VQVSRKTTAPRASNRAVRCHGGCLTRARLSTRGLVPASPPRGSSGGGGGLGWSHGMRKAPVRLCVTCGGEVASGDKPVPPLGLRLRSQALGAVHAQLWGGDAAGLDLSHAEPGGRWGAPAHTLVADEKGQCNVGVWTAAKHEGEERHVQQSTVTAGVSHATCTLAVPNSERPHHLSLEWHGMVVVWERCQAS